MNQAKIKTEFSDIDNKINCLESSDLICIAARTAMGKTTLALDIATNIAKNKIPILYISLDLSKQHIINKFIKIEGKTRDDYSTVIDNINLLQENIKVVDRTFTIEDIENICRKEKIDRNIGLVIIDYFQLIKINSSNIEQKFKEKCKRLKILAKELKIPIIILSQISKDVDTRKNKRPVLADFKMSSCIVDYADKIFFIYRDNYYNNKNANENITEIIIAKNSRGNLGTVKLLNTKII